MAPCFQLSIKFIKGLSRTFQEPFSAIHCSQVPFCFAVDVVKCEPSRSSFLNHAVACCSFGGSRNGRNGRTVMDLSSTGVRDAAQPTLKEDPSDQVDRKPRRDFACGILHNATNSRKIWSTQRLHDMWGALRMLRWSIFTARYFLLCSSRCPSDVLSSLDAFCYGDCLSFTSIIASMK